MLRSLREIPVPHASVFGLHLALVQRWEPGEDEGLLSAAGEYTLRFCVRGPVAGARRDLGRRLAQMLNVHTVAPPTLIGYDAEVEMTRMGEWTLDDLAGQVRAHASWVGHDGDSYLLAASMSMLLDALAEVQRADASLLVGWERACEARRQPFDAAQDLLAGVRALQ